MVTELLVLACLVQACGVPQQDSTGATGSECLQELIDALRDGRTEAAAHCLRQLESSPPPGEPSSEVLSAIASKILETRDEDLFVEWVDSIGTRHSTGLTLTIVQQIAQLVGSASVDERLGAYRILSYHEKFATNLVPGILSKLEDRERRGELDWSVDAFGLAAFEDSRVYSYVIAGWERAQLADFELNTSGASVALACADINELAYSRRIERLLPSLMQSDAATLVLCAQHGRLDRVRSLLKEFKESLVADPVAVLCLEVRLGVETTDARVLSGLQERFRDVIRHDLLREQKNCLVVAADLLWPLTRTNRADTEYFENWLPRLARQLVRGTTAEVRSRRLFSEIEATARAWRDAEVIRYGTQICLDTGRHPSSLGHVHDLLKQLGVEPLPPSVDPWGSPYELIVEGRTLTVRSPGPDQVRSSLDDLAMQFDRDR